MPDSRSNGHEPSVSPEHGARQSGAKSVMRASSGGKPRWPAWTRDAPGGCLPRCPVEAELRRRPAEARALAEARHVELRMLFKYTLMERECLRVSDLHANSPSIVLYCSFISSRLLLYTQHWCTSPSYLHTTCMFFDFRGIISEVLRRRVLAYSLTELCLRYLCTWH